MSLSRVDFDAICESDLAELVDALIPEDQHLDYKRDVYGSATGDRKELLKDVSAFANVNGGHIVIGGVATDLCGIQHADVGAEILRIEHIINSGIEPRIPGFKVRSVHLASGSDAIVMRIPKSWRAPHRVRFDNWNKFWIRNSAGAHEASMDELRTLFTLSASTIDRARAFRAERMALLTTGTGPNPSVSNGPIPLAASGRFVLHIIPLSAVSSTASVDPEHIYNHRAAFTPVGEVGLSSHYNLDGLINRQTSNITHGYTQIFRNGIVEAAMGNLIIKCENGQSGIAALKFERNIFRAFSNYINGLDSIAVEPPLIMMFSLEGLKGARYFVRNSFELPPFDRDVIQLPECVIERFGSDADYHRAVKPAFDALWNATGFSGSKFFDKDTGLWNGQWSAAD